MLYNISTCQSAYINYFTASLHLCFQMKKKKTSLILKTLVYVRMFTSAYDECEIKCGHVHVIHMSGKFFGSRNHQRLHYNQPQNGRKLLPFLRPSDIRMKKSCCLFGLKIPHVKTLPELTESSSSADVGQRLTIIEDEKGLLSKHFLGSDSWLMRVLIAVTHADEGSMDRVPYSDMC